jgi:prevent-host-death family protein
MREVTLRDANQQFSKLVREVEETGETITVMRKGKPAVKIVAVEEKVNGRTPEQEAALKRLLDPKNHFKSPPGWKFNRDEVWDDIVSRHSVVRKSDERLKEPPKRQRKRA